MTPSFLNGLFFGVLGGIIVITLNRLIALLFKKRG